MNRKPVLKPIPVFKKRSSVRQPMNKVLVRELISIMDKIDNTTNEDLLIMLRKEKDYIQALIDKECNSSGIR